MLCESGGSVAKRKRKSSVEKNKKIQEASLLLKDGKITAATFLSRMVYAKNGICVNMVEEQNIFQEEPDNVLSEDLDDPPSYSQNIECLVCQDKSSNIVLLPCKHMKVCDECNLKLQADAISKGMQNYICPYCRTIVEDTMQIYT